MLGRFADLYVADGSPKISGLKPRTTLMKDDGFRDSPGASLMPQKVLIVYNATKEFDMKPLIWALENIVHGGCCTVTLLGIMPYLNMPLSIKVWADIWTYPDLDLSAVRDMQNRRQNIKSLKIHVIIDLCKRYMVTPRIKLRQGYPRRLLVVEEITKLHPTWVIFDRHFKKASAYYAKIIPFNMVVMNGNGFADMIRGQSMIGDCSFGTPGESPATLPPTPEFLMSEQLLKDIRRKAELEKHETDKLEEFIYEI